MRDLKNNLGVVQLLDPQDVAGSDTYSLLLDTFDFNAAEICVLVGALTGVSSSNYLTPILQESDSTTASDFTTVASSDMHGAFTKIDATDEDQLVQMVGYIGSKRYLRVKLDYTGTITAALVAVIGIVGRARIAGTSAPTADSPVGTPA